METATAPSGLNSLELVYTLVAVLVALSVASERLAEIIKGVIPGLNNENPNPTREGYRKAAIQSLAVICGLVTVLLARPALKNMLPDPWNNTGTFLALGFLTSGGSGFWNGILGYVRNVKEIKKGEVASERALTRKRSADRLDD